jgi:hypothetical protein
VPADRSHGALAIVGGVLGESEPFDEIGEHRGVGVPEVELAILDLDEVLEETGEEPALLGDETFHPREELVVGDRGNGRGDKRILHPALVPRGSSGPLASPPAPSAPSRGSRDGRGSLAAEAKRERVPWVDLAGC